MIRASLRSETGTRSQVSASIPTAFRIACMLCWALRAWFCWTVVSVSFIALPVCTSRLCMAKEKFHVEQIKFHAKWATLKTCQVFGM